MNSEGTFPSWQTNPWVHRAILLARPLLIFLLNPNWTFQGFGNFDPFYYFGQFIHFPHYQKLQPTYSGERLPWVLPVKMKISRKDAKAAKTPTVFLAALRILACFA